MMGLMKLIRYGVTEPEEYEVNKPYYIMKGDGVYRHRSTGAAIIKERHVGFSGGSVPGLEKGEEGIDYMLPKIPFKYYLMILDFYKAVNDKDRTEASVHIFYHEGELDIPEELEENKVGLLVEGEWIIYCPQQVNSQGLTSFGDDGLYKWLRENTYSVIETHSHHTMGAFWSGTDINNQQDPQYYGVFGEIGTKDTFLMKFVVNGEFEDLSADEIFEYPMVKTVVTVEDVEGYEGLSTAEDLQVEDVPYIGVFGRRNEFPEVWLTECHSVSGRGKQRKEKAVRKKKGVPKEDIGESPSKDKKEKTVWYDEKDTTKVVEEVDVVGEDIEPTTENGKEVVEEAQKVGDGK